MNKRKRVRHDDRTAHNPWPARRLPARRSSRRWPRGYRALSARIGPLWSADIKGRPSIVARTNVAGAYRIPGFGKDISPTNVTISCVKEGYKQARTLLKTRPSKTPPTAVEIECTMQRLGAK